MTPRRRPRWRRPHPGTLVIALLGALVLGIVVVAATADDGGSGSDDNVPGADGGEGALRTVVIGDSGIAGGGAQPYDSSEPLCFRSRASWPRQLAADLAAAEDSEVRLDIVDDRSCGGATVDELLAPWPEREQPAQIPRPDTDPDVDLVLVGIGGNDFSLGELIMACAGGDCADQTDAEAAATARTELEARLERLEQRLVDDVHPALRAAYPAARIVHVGYIRPVPAPGRIVDGCTWLDDGEQQALADAVGALNDTIVSAVRRTSTAAASAGAPPIAFLDLFEALEGHELCSADPAVHPLGTVEQAHATAEGYGAIAEAAADALPAVLDVDR